MAKEKNAGGWRTLALRFVGVVLACLGVVLTVLGFTPVPSVSSGGTDALIALCEGLRAAGTGAVIVLAVGSLFVGLMRLRSPRWSELINVTAPPSRSEERSWSRYVLAPALVAVIAVGTGLGAEAGRGAREPIEQALSGLIGAEGVPTVVLSQPEAKPFNRSVVSKPQVDAVQEWALSSGYTPIAYRLALGDAANLSSGAHPSSASIVALPTDRVPDLRPSGSELPVMTTAQFASVGDRLSVEGHDAVVVKTVDWFPGLDRTAVVMSEAGYDELSDEPEPYSGVLVGGATPAVVQDHLSSAGIGLSAISVRSWLNSYDRFWDRSVTPVIMQYMLAVALVGGVAASFIRTADVLRRRRQIAIHNVMGVQKAMLVRAEFLRAFLETAKATLYAALPAIGLIAVANSSQFGMNMGASLGGLGAGALLVGASMAMGTLGAMRAIRRLDAANEIR